MSKYEPLTRHLRASRKDRVPMTFRELERILGFRLPRSSREHRAWWANTPEGHVNAQAWHEAGYKSSEVDLEKERLVFLKLNEAAAGAGGSPPPPPPAGLVDPQEWAARSGKTLPPVFGCLKGLVTVPDDLDLTEPADPDWGKRVYGDEL